MIDSDPGRHPMQRPGFLEYRDFRYLKQAALLAGFALLGYGTTRPPGGEAHGGTWFGYVLGISSALIVLLLAWYGIRKRRMPTVADRRKASRRRAIYADANGPAAGRGTDRRKTRPEDYWRYGGTLQGWLSAHVYLGSALVVLTSLHSGIRLGWNVHSLTYVLVLLVAASGIFGVFAYQRYPRLHTENLGADTLADLLTRIAGLDELARVRALALPDEVNAAVSAARLGTRIGGNAWRQLWPTSGTCPTDQAVARIQELGKRLVAADQPKLMRDLYAVLLQKQRLVARARNAIRLEARMKFWLYVHAPLAMALLASLLAHVVSVLVYW